MSDLIKSLPPFAQGYRAEKFVPKYKLSGCTINGNFPEMNTAIFCYLYNSTLYTSANKTISQDIGETGLCSKIAEFNMNDWKLWDKINDDFRRIVFIQHPLERFVRSYKKLCKIERKCFNCQDNLSCFMRKLLKQHEKTAEGLAGPVRTFITNHFSPQTWNCHFNREFQKIRTVKIGGNQTERAEFSDNLNEILGEQGVAQEVQRIIKEEVLKIPLELSPDERELAVAIKRDHDDLYRLFRYLYEHDFIVFGYPF